MKKITLIAAAAALLLSGGIFMKAHVGKSSFEQLASNVEILAQTEDVWVIYMGEGNAPVLDQKLSEYEYTWGFYQPCNPYNNCYIPPQSKGKLKEGWCVPNTGYWCNKGNEYMVVITY